MSRKITTPVNQVRLTNVAVVRMKKTGKRFEIACYPNKVLPWRQKIETNIREVLQSERVFSNVSKGTFAKKAELLQAFNTDDEKEICLQILEKGELQVTNAERQHEQDSLFHEIATIVAEKCINPFTQRPITVGIVERAMKEVHFSVKPGKSAKTQALQVIKLLQEKPESEGGIPLQRAYMRLEITAPKPTSRRLIEALTPLIVNKEDEDTDEDLRLICTVDPGSYRAINEIVSKITKSKGSVEVIDVSVHEEGDEEIESAAEISSMVISSPPPASAESSSSSSAVPSE